MKHKPTYIVIAFLINLGLLLGNAPGLASASAESSNAFWFPCCKKTDQGHRYCCAACCYFRWDCMADVDCQPRR